MPTDFHYAHRFRTVSVFRHAKIELKVTGIVFISIMYVL